MKRKREKIYKTRNDKGVGSLQQLKRLFSGSPYYLLFASGNMASGMAVSDGVIKVFNDMKVR